MKKTQKFLAIIFLCFAFSCMDSHMVDPQRPGTNALAVVPPAPAGSIPDLSVFNTFVERQLNNVFRNQSPYIYRVDKHFFVNYERFIRDQVPAYNTFFGKQLVNPTTFADGFNFESVPTTYVKPSQLPDVWQVYNPKQLAIIDKFSALMYDATGHSSLDNAAFLVTYDVKTSTLTNEEKAEVIAFANISLFVARDFFYNDTNFVKSVIQTLDPSTYSSGGCTIRWRSVWLGAVVGGVGGAVAGVKVGASGGTVAFPGLGTATGAVAGGIFGFATGFAGGAGYGIAAELLGSCFSKHIKRTGSWPAYECKQFPPLIPCGVTENADTKLVYVKEKGYPI